VPGASVRVDGSPVHATDVSGLVVDPGEHVVYVTKPGFEPLEQVLRATDGENVHLVLPLAPINAGGSAPRPHQLSVESRSTASMLPGDRAADRAADEVTERTPLWVPWLVTGALASGWLTTAGLSIKARHDRDRIERPEISDERIEDARRLHMTLAVVSDILLVSTLASAGVSAYLTWWPEPDAPTRGSGARAGSVADGLSLGVSGRF
jgi:hypothetical protein